MKSFVAMATFLVLAFINWKQKNIIFYSPAGTQSDFLLLLVYVGTPETIFDRNSLKSLTSQIIKVIFQK